MHWLGYSFRLERLMRYSLDMFTNISYVSLESLFIVSFHLMSRVLANNVKYNPKKQGVEVILALS